MFRAIQEQLDTVFRGDPAAKSRIEIIFCYPGFHAILLHRMAHKLHQSGFVLGARILSQLNRFLTGKRHPTVGNKVVIGAGAKILGNITIGNNAKVGAGSVVIRPVPDDSTVVGVPGRVTRRRLDSGDNLEHGQLPDPEGQLIDELSRRIEQLEAQVRMLTEERLAERR